MACDRHTAGWCVDPCVVLGLCSRHLQARRDETIFLDSGNAFRGVNIRFFHPHLGAMALAVAGIAIVIALARWSNFAGIAVFFADECVHALVARAMAETGGLILPANALMVGSFQFDYPPMFHLLNASSSATMGPAVFPFFNIVIAGLLFLLVCGDPADSWNLLSGLVWRWSWSRPRCSPCTASGSMSKC